MLGAAGVLALVVLAQAQAQLVRTRTCAQLGLGLEESLELGRFVRAAPAPVCSSIRRCTLPHGVGRECDLAPLGRTAG